MNTIEKGSQSPGSEFSKTSVTRGFLSHLPPACRLLIAGTFAFGSVAVEKASADFSPISSGPNIDGGGPGCPPPSDKFKLGFGLLAQQISCTVGTPLENEHHGPNGDSLQQTTTGLMVWRKADNWTAFTDGARTWVNGPFGVMERGNNERFEWEAQKSPEELFRDKVNADKQAHPGVYKQYISADGYMVKAPEGVSLQTVENVAIRITWNLRDRPDLVKTLSDKAQYIIFPNNMSVIQLPEWADLAGTKTANGSSIGGAVAITRQSKLAISSVREDYAQRDNVIDHELALSIKRACMDQNTSATLKALYLEYKNNKPSVFGNSLSMVSEGEFFASLSEVFFGSLGRVTDKARILGTTNGIATTEQLRDKAPDVYSFIMSFYHPNFVNTGK